MRRFPGVKFVFAGLSLLLKAMFTKKYFWKLYKPRATYFTKLSKGWKKEIESLNIFVKIAKPVQPVNHGPIGGFDSGERKNTNDFVTLPLCWISPSPTTEHKFSCDTFNKYIFYLSTWRTNLKSTNGFLKHIFKLPYLQMH